MSPHGSIPGIHHTEQTVDKGERGGGGREDDEQNVQTKALKHKQNATTIALHKCGHESGA